MIFDNNMSILKEEFGITRNLPINSKRKAEPVQAIPPSVDSPKMDVNPAAEETKMPEYVPNDSHHEITTEEHVTQEEQDK